MFDKLHKPKGYPFASVELGRVVTTDAEERVVAQVDATEAIKFMQELALKYRFTSEEESRAVAIANNCHGMIHIFAPSQVELVESADYSHEHHDECDHNVFHKVEVMLNARVEIFDVDDKVPMLTYKDIVERVGHQEEDVVTVTWHCSNTGGGGTLIKGQAVEYQAGMVINAMITNNA